jgi:predicted enzyme related to lactoylglutathione lyase
MTSTLLLTFAIAAAFGGTTPLQLRVSMISLGVKDSARSIKFYSETLGMEIVGKPGEVAMVRAGNVTIVLNQPAGAAARNGIAGSMEIIFPVESVAASYDDLKQRGCDFAAAPHEITAGTWAATFRDPDGHLLTILGPK